MIPRPYRMAERFRHGARFYRVAPENGKSQITSRTTSTATRNAISQRNGLRIPTPPVLGRASPPMAFRAYASITTDGERPAGPTIRGSQ